MTEEEWEGCLDPQVMLRFLGDTVPDRKLRLFACAVARLALRGRASWEAIDVAEGYAAGKLSHARLKSFHAGFPRELVAEFLVREDAASGALGVARHCFEVKTSAPLLRCIVGNPFRPFTPDPAWLRCNDGAVVKLARVIDDERELSSGALDVARLAILADALEEAGCADRAALDHLRGPGPHARGCHVVAAILGRP